jgi:hypothetical protein
MRTANWGRIATMTLSVLAIMLLTELKAAADTTFLVPGTVAVASLPTGAKASTTSFFGTMVMDTSTGTLTDWTISMPAIGELGAFQFTKANSPPLSTCHWGIELEHR